MAMDAIDTIRKSEAGAEENMQNALKKADELISLARTDGEALLKKTVASARENMAGQIETARVKAEETYKQLMSTYSENIKETLAASEANHREAIDAVIHEILN